MMRYLVSLVWTLVSVAHRATCSDAHNAIRSDTLFLSDCQYTVAHNANVTITKTSLDNVTFPVFLRQKPSLERVSATMVSIKMVVNDEDSVETPAGRLSTVGIKMKSRGAISGKRKLEDDIHCSDLHAMSLLQALETLSTTERAAYGHRTRRLVFSEDKEYRTGLWDFSKIEVSTAVNDTAVRLVSPRFLTAPWIPSLGGMFYCKLVPPSAIAAWIRGQLVR